VARGQRIVLSREEYTLRSIERAFPSGEWVEKSSLDPERGSAPMEDRGPEGLPPLSITIIGGTKYDEDALESYLLHSDATHLIVGAGQGAEADAYTWWDDLNGDITKIVPNPDVYGKNARKVNVEAVLSHDPTSPLLLVGSGERVKQAEAWLKRANWGREVIRIG